MLAELQDEAVVHVALRVQAGLKPEKTQSCSKLQNRIMFPLQEHNKVFKDNRKNDF